MERAELVLTELADWYIQNGRRIEQAELDTILAKHCRDEAEIKKFSDFMQSTPGQRRLSTLLRERKEGDNPGPKRTTTVHDRFTIDCSVCGFVTSAQSLSEALSSARNVAKRHNSPEEKVTVFDVMAQKGACQLYDPEGNCLERKEATEKSYLKEPGQTIAKELGLRYDGVQEKIGLQFTDPKTGSTFYANTLEEARRNLIELRKKFQTHSSDPTYHEPASVPEALKSSMAEETTAADWYRRRAQYSEGEGDKKSAGLWKHVAGEENTHRSEFQERLEQLRKASGQRPSYLRGPNA